VFWFCKKEGEFIQINVAKCSAIMSEISSFAQKMVDDCLLYCALILCLFLLLRSFEDDQWYSFNDQTVSKVFFNSCNCLTEFDCFFKPRSTLVRDAKVVKLTSKIYEGRKQFSYHFPVLIPYRHRIKISNRGATQRCNVSSFFMQKYAVYWPEGGAASQYSVFIGQKMSVTE
jgi:hypothetical protein